MLGENILIEIIKLGSQVTGLVGDITKPWQIKKTAKAEGEAEVLRLTGMGFSEEQAREICKISILEKNHINNYMNIVKKAIPSISNNVEKVENSSTFNDWILHFYDKASKCTIEEIQHIWARILAGEINKSGSFSKQTLSVLENIEISQAKAFNEVTSLLFFIDSNPYIILHNKNIFRDLNPKFTYDDLIQLQSLGLVSIDSSVFGSGYNPQLEFNSSEPVECNYFGEKFILIPKKSRKNTFYILNGIINLTKPGRELISICDSNKNDDFFKYTLNQWKKFE